MPFDREAYRERLKQRLEQSRREFEGEYGEALEELLGLSEEEIGKITPDITDTQKYNELIEVVKEASASNVAQAELRASILELGEVAVKIAKKVPRLAQFL